MRIGFLKYLCYNNISNTKKEVLKRNFSKSKEMFRLGKYQRKKKGRRDEKKM